jgi:hypothetical protein
MRIIMLYIVYTHIMELNMCDLIIGCCLLDVWDYYMYGKYVSVVDPFVIVSDFTNICIAYRLNHLKI